MVRNDSHELPETRFARSDDVSIAYQVMGDGPVNIVVVPGIVSHVEAFHEFPGYSDWFRRLARFARVITFDKRGQGLSDRVAGAPTLEERSDDIRAVMDEIGIQSSAIVGISEGAIMSAFFAASHPDRVSHLILYGAMPKFVVAEGMSDELWGEMIRGVAAKYGDGSMLMAAAPSLANNGAMTTLAARLERLSCSPGNFRSLMEMNLHLDVRHVLPDIQVPTLVLHRRTDLLAPIEGGRYFAATIPGARLIEHDSGDHVHVTGNYAALCADIEEFITGERPNAYAATERVLATVLFTDIVDSTILAARLGDAIWRQTLEEHDRIAQRLIEQQRGRLMKMTGDGVMAMFDGPGRAIRCALAMEPALARLGLSVRAGLHTGEVEDRGDDIGGIAVHAAARVMGKAGAGEVLVSRVVVDLVAGSGIGFAARGDVELKGLPGTWPLFAAGV